MDKIIRLKKEYEGMIIARKIEYSLITFDSNKILQEHYVNYYNKGFEDIFEVIEIDNWEALNNKKGSKK
jgi:hypothetical protein